MESGGCSPDPERNYNSETSFFNANTCCVLFHFIMMAQNDIFFCEILAFGLRQKAIKKMNVLLCIYNSFIFRLVITIVCSEESFTKKVNHCRSLGYWIRIVFPSDGNSMVLAEPSSPFRFPRRLIEASSSPVRISGTSVFPAL